MGNHLYLARTNMVNNQVSPSDVTDHRVLETMLKIPRELFVPAELAGVAYSDASLRISGSRRLTAPAAFARLVQLAQVASNDIVLDIGCSTGYSTAVFSHLAKKVTSIEPEEKLASGANYTLNQLGVRNAIIISEILTDGHPEGGPYNVIFLNDPVEEISEQLIDQLADGGRLVAILKQQGQLGQAVLIERHGETVTRRIMFSLNVPCINFQA